MYFMVKFSTVQKSWARVKKNFFFLLYDDFFFFIENKLFNISKHVL